MQAVGFPVLSWIMVLVIGGGTGLPLGIPPQPEDPVMARVAPQQCLVYLSWAGTSKPDPQSKNQTEQTCAKRSSVSPAPSP